MHDDHLSAPTMKLEFLNLTAESGSNLSRVCGLHDLVPHRGRDKDVSRIGLPKPAGER